MFMGVLAYVLNTEPTIVRWWTAPFLEIADMLIFIQYNLAQIGLISTIYIGMPAGEISFDR